MQSNLCIYALSIHSVYLQVHYKDKVKFESVKTEGQFLHCSSKRFEDVGFHVLKNKSVMELLFVMCIVTMCRCSFCLSFPFLV